MRTIDADALEKYLSDAEIEATRQRKYVFASALNTICGNIKNFPTIEPERKRGKWIYAEHDIAMCDGYRCDQCGFFVPWDYNHKFIDFIKDYYWCPSCGADMRGEE